MTKEIKQRKQIIVDLDLWKVLQHWKLDRNFRSLNSLLWSLVKEEESTNGKPNTN